jgi:hypothetical protein
MHLTVNQDGVRFDAGIASQIKGVFMKVKMRKRPLANFGPASCRCCSRLSWKHLKQDNQTLKEAIDDINDKGE